TRVLAQRALALGAHARVGQDLGHGVTRSRAFLALVGAGQMADIVNGMVIADELNPISNRLYEVFFFDQSRHGDLIESNKNGTSGPTGGPHYNQQLILGLGAPAYLPCHTGLRFSAKAVAPSLASADVKIWAISGRWRSNIPS